MFQLLITVVVNITRAVAWLFLCIGYLPPWLIAMPTASPSHAVSQSSWRSPMRQTTLLPSVGWLSVFLLLPVLNPGLGHYSGASSGSHGLPRLRQFFGWCHFQGLGGFLWLLLGFNQFCVNSCFTDSTCFSTMFEIANNSSLSLMAFSPFVSVNGIIWALVSQAAVSALGGKSARQRRLRTVLGRQDLLRKWNKKWIF